MKSGRYRVASGAQCVAVEIPVEIVAVVARIPVGISGGITVGMLVGFLFQFLSGYRSGLLVEFCWASLPFLPAGFTEPARSAGSARSGAVP